MEKANFWSFLTTFTKYTFIFCIIVFLFKDCTSITSKINKSIKNIDVNNHNDNNCNCQSYNHYDEENNKFYKYNNKNITMKEIYKKKDNIDYK
ncbi:MAG: hypothetical protein OEY79_02715 [Anaplasmataceae bacterium]|nr:hypothetical protein [Anaplasmataceae bacterium]